MLEKEDVVSVKECGLKLVVFSVGNSFEKFDTTRRRGKWTGSGT
jgi:hypothetical protein